MAAGAKQYQLFFQLTAALGPNFSQTFKTASKTMTTLQTDIKGANQKLKDVSAYKRQQLAVEESKNKVSELEKEHAKLQAEYEETGGKSKSLEKKLESNAKALEKAKDKVAEEEDKLSKLNGTLKEAGINTENLDKSTADLQREYERLASTQEKVQKISEKQAANKEAIGNTKTQLAGLAGTVAAIGAAIYAGPVKKSAEFQEQMSGVKAISGATQGEMERLATKAKEMGAATKFTATEAGQAMEYMAMAGRKTEDMLGGIEGIMNLAAASREELASVSDIVTDALTAFGLSASDAGHFSDVLAQASSNANTNVSMMGATFQKVAPVAGAMGYSVEDMSLGIGLMANASIKAEVAGTSLKTALANMAKPTKQQATYMKKYGISLTNTDGTMKSFSEVVENLRGSLGGLAEQEQIAAATAIFGKESFAGMLAIVNASEQDYNKLTEAVYNCDGAAKKMAETKLDNLNGSITLAKSAFDALQVELGELLLPTFTDVVKKGTEILNVITDFVRKNPEAVKTIAKVTGGLLALKAGGLVAKLGFLEAKGGILSVQKAFTLIKGLGLNKYLSGLTGGFLNFKNIGGGILGYFRGIKGAAGGVSTALGSILNNSVIFTKLSGFFGGIAGKLGGVLTSAGRKILNKFLNPFTRIGGKLGGIMSGLGGIIARSPLGTVGKVIGAGFGKITKFIAPVGNAIKTMLGPLGNLTGKIFGPLGGVIGKILPIVGVITAVITVFQILKNHLQEIRGFIQKTFGDEALAVFDKIVSVVTNVGNTIKNIFSDGNIGQARNKIQEIFGDNGVKVFDTLVNVLGTVRKAVSDVIQFVTDNVVPVAEQVFQVLITQIIPGIVGFMQAAAPTIMTIIQGIVDFIGAVIPIIGEFIKGLMPVISEIVGFIQTYVLPIISQVFSFITGTVMPAITTAIQAILPVITNILSVLLPIIQTALTTIWNIVAPIVQGILSVVQAVMPSILSIIARSPLGTVGKVIGAGFGKITKFIAPVGNAIKTMLGPLGNLTGKIFGPLGGVIGKILPIVGVITAVITVFQILKNHLQEIRGFIQKTFGDEALAVFDKIVSVVTNVGNTIKNIFSDGNIGQARNKIQEIFGDNGVKVFDTLVNVLGTVRKAVSDVIQFVTDNVVPVAEQVFQVLITQIIPGIVGFMQAAAPTIMTIIQGIVDFIGAVIPIIGEFIKGLMPVISEIVGFIQTYVLPIISQVFSFITGTVMPAITTAIQAILPVITNILSVLLPIIQTALTTIWNIVAPIVQGILSVVQAVMPSILSIVSSVVGAISGVISGFSQILSGLIAFITGVFTGNWSQAWNGIKDIFSGAFEGLKSIAKGAINGVIGIINTAISGLNKIKIPEWVPGVGGKGINIPKVPGFAKGTDRTPGTFIAGERGPELITNAAGRKVFTAAQTGQIFNNMANAGNVNTANNVNAGMSGAGTITIHVTNSPSVTVAGGETRNIKEQLEQYDEAFLEKLRAIIVMILKEQREQEGRVVYA